MEEAVAALGAFYGRSDSAEGAAWLATRIGGEWRQQFMAHLAGNAPSAGTGAALVGAGLCVLPNVSFLSPRAKLSVEVIEAGVARGLALTDANKGVTYALSVAAIAHAFTLTIPARNSKAPEFASHMWLLQLRTDTPGLAVHFRGSKKPLAWVCFQFELKGKAAKAGWPADTQIALRRPWAAMENASVLRGTLPSTVETLMCEVVCGDPANPLPLVRADKSVFCSSTGTSAIKCYHGVHDGLLYPLPNGILFMKKPFIFIAAETIGEFVFGRGGSAVGRTVDVVITTDAGAVHEFGMIDKVETEPLRRYAAHLAKLRERADRRAVNEEGGASGASALSGAGGAAACSSASSSVSSSAGSLGSVAVEGGAVEGAAAEGEMEQSEEDSEDAESDYDPEGAARENSGGSSDDESDSDDESGSDDESDEGSDGERVCGDAEEAAPAAVVETTTPGYAAPPVAVQSDAGEETEEDDAVRRVPSGGTAFRSGASAATTLKRDEPSGAAVAAGAAGETKTEPAASAAAPPAKKARLLTDMFKAIPAQS